MKASDVVAVLVDPDNIVTTTVTIPEGFTVKQIVDRLVKETGFKKAEFEAALQDPQALGPARRTPRATPRATCSRRPTPFGPNEKPADMLHDMVARWQQAADRQRPRGRRRGARLHAARDHDDRQPDRGRGPREVPRQDRPGHLQPAGEPRQRARPTGCSRSTRRSTTRSAATTSAVGLTAGRTSRSTRRTTPARTRGCRPARSSRPATTRSRPRCTPADGPWLWYVTVNLKTGETKFTDDYDTFHEFKQEYQRVLRDRPTRAEAVATREVRGPRRPDRPLAVAGDPPGGLRGAGARRTGSTTRCRCRPAGWPAFLDGLDPAEWRGLSLTMPLKREALPLLGSYDEWVAATGACNTVLLEPDGSRHGLNTDVTGALMVLGEHDVAAGAGRGARRRRDRHVDAAGPGRARACGTPRSWSATPTGPPRPCTRWPRTARRRRSRWRCSTTSRRWPATSWSPRCPPRPRCPSCSPRSPSIPLVFDVVYEPWPTPLAAAAERSGRTVLSGLDLLVAQAVNQVVAMTGRYDVPAGAMRRAAEEALAARSAR